MKRHATESNPINNNQRQSHGPKFAKVLDGRKQPIRELWVRNGRFYARLNIENPISGIKKTPWRAQRLFCTFQGLGFGIFPER